MAEQGVTVVIPTLNRGGFLRACLEDLLAQSHRPLEILIVDQSDEVGQDLRELVEQHAGIISHHQVSFRGLPLARNYGWQRARYDAILFVDDDTRCPPDLVSEHLRALQMTGVGAVAGGIDERYRPADSGPLTGIYRAWTATPLRGFGALGEGDVHHAGGGNFSVWRRAILAAGGADETLNQGAALYEETDLCLRIRRAGFRIVFNGRARLTHLAAAGGGCRVDQVQPYVRAGP